MPFVDFKGDVQQLGQDQGREGDGHDVQERVFEQEYSQQHNNTSLIDALEHPNEERFVRQRTALLKFLVELGVFEGLILVNVFVEHQ